MEIKINREIRNYTETMFFGLSMRQFFFSLAGVGAAIGLFFLLRPYAGTETLSWVCMLGAAPFIAMGFITYNGMTAEKFVIAWVKSKFIEPQKVKFECGTLYHGDAEKSRRATENTSRGTVKARRAPGNDAHYHGDTNKSSGRQPKLLSAKGEKN